METPVEIINDIRIKATSYICKYCGRNYDTCPCYEDKIIRADQFLFNENHGITDYWYED